MHLPGARRSPALIRGQLGANHYYQYCQPVLSTAHDLTAAQYGDCAHFVFLAVLSHLQVVALRLGALPYRIVGELGVLRSRMSG